MRHSVTRWRWAIKDYGQKGILVQPCWGSSTLAARCPGAGMGVKWGK